MEKAYNFIECEKKWYRLWGKDLFKGGDESAKKSTGTIFSMILPPPDVTGTLHMGHALTFTIQDIIARRKKMQGLNTLWLPGLDHAGIATQMAVEKSLKEEKGLTKEDLGREKFLEIVRNWQKKSGKQIIRQVSKLGLSLDWSRKKFTPSDEMKKAVDKVFVQLYREGVIYRGPDLKEQGLIEKEEDYVHVEPNVSKQWFLKTAGLAKPAVEAVEKGDITFIPEKWTKVYFNWMDNTRDWCISRQLWWGHRVPAYYCGQCRHMMVEEETPTKCDECGSGDIARDPDVLDAGFSSALWPFTIPGRQDNGRDFKDFYPTSLMAAGFDFIFSRVARMIMMGIHCGKDVPFREVLINGLIRDEKGRKMSKTRNNAIGPLDVIAEYGSDALRFTLAVQAVPGMDISLSLNRVKGYKAFANKIWNASRYVIMNLQGDEDFDIDFSKTTDTDKWILHGLNNTVEKVNDLMDNYRLDEAADMLYHFFWHEYCDWYLEFSRNDSDNPDTRKTLKFVLSRLLQMLHPFMPFITEELYQKINGGGKKFLLQTEFPSFGSELVFSREFTAVRVLKKVTMETRKTRTENKIDPHRRITVFLKTESQKEGAVLSRNMKYFDFLTRSAKSEVVKNFSGLPKGYRGGCLNWEVLLPFDSDEDRLNELARLKKEFDRLEKQIGSLEKKLARKGFINKAPGQVLAGFKKNLQENIGKREKIRKTWDDLS